MPDEEKEKEEDTDEQHCDGEPKKDKYFADGDCVMGFLRRAPLISRNSADFLIGYHKKAHKDAMTYTTCRTIDLIHRGEIVTSPSLEISAFPETAIV